MCSDELRLTRAAFPCLGGLSREHTQLPLPGGTHRAERQHAAAEQREPLVRRVARRVLRSPRIRAAPQPPAASAATPDAHRHPSAAQRAPLAIVTARRQARQ